MSRTKEAGDRGESAAAQYLRGLGAEILDAQWRCRFGELDLVARDKGVICFVEVKLRGPGAIAKPREFVTASKQAKLRKTALLWLSANRMSDAFCRFDVAEVYESADGSLRIEYLKNAFT